jgi:hypothetical protein
MPRPASVPKLRGYCNVLGDDWMSYGDWAEQLTYLLFLKILMGASPGSHLNIDISGQKE